MDGKGGEGNLGACGGGENVDGREAGGFLEILSGHVVGEIGRVGVEMSDALEGKIRGAIEGAGGVVGFDVFMGMALYDEAGGYYAGEREVTGRGGDFYTSVSVGPLFGAILAAAIADAWEGMGRPGKFDVVEQGAHDGQLMADVMGAMSERVPACFAAMRCGIVEPLSGFRGRQMERLGEWSEKVRWWDSVEVMPEVEGVFYCNELVDAFPVKRVRFEGEGWRELGVGMGGDNEFEWRTRGIEDGSALAREVSGWGTDFAEGYTTEVNLAMVEWVGAVAKCLQRGVLLVVDYGFEDDEYLAPEREEGTLRSYRGHRAGEDVLSAVGEQDLTAHVNFSRLGSAVEATGMRVIGVEDQHDFVMRAGRGLLEEREGVADAGFAKQFQTLMHPGMMGRVFKVARFEKG